MSERISMMNLVPAKPSPADVEFFDPPMCCPTGLCGPTLDQTLLDVNEMILALQRQNLRVERYQMSGNPKAFLGNAEVMRLVREKEIKALPITWCGARLSKREPTREWTKVKAMLNGEAL